jgi:hypothetical protein
MGFTFADKFGFLKLPLADQYNGFCDAGTAQFESSSVGCLFKFWNSCRKNLFREEDALDSCIPLPYLKLCGCRCVESIFLCTERTTRRLTVDIFGFAWFRYRTKPSMPTTLPSFLMRPFSFNHLVKTLDYPGLILVSRDSH